MTELETAHPRVPPWLLTSVAAGFGGAVTLVVTLVPGLRFAYRSLGGHLVLETFDACVAAVVALLFFGRARRSRSTSDLAICFAFVLFTLAGVVLAALPIVAEHRTPAMTSWLPLVIRLAGAALIALAAAAPPRALTRQPHLGRVVVWGMAWVAVVLVFATTVGRSLPRLVDPTVSPSDAGHPLLDNTVLAIMQALHAVLYGCAAVAFVQRARRTGDEITSWLAAGSALAAWARVNYLLFPSLYSEWLYTGDLLRTLFYLTLVVGAFRELQSYWAVQTDAAVFAERRRLARELHDGTVQELGYIRTMARRLANGDADAGQAERVLAAADRALAETRRAITALTAPMDEPVAEAVHRAACEMADRYDIELAFTAEGDSQLPASDREALVRIAREAVSNAARHGGASQVHLLLEPCSMTVVDNGSGFTPRANHGGFGLASMRDRAEGMRGRLDVRANDDVGTTVRVVWGESTS